MSRKRTPPLWRRLLPWFLLVPAAATLTALELWLKPPRPTPRVEPEIVWTFVAPARGAIISSPAVVDGRVYIGAIREGGFSPGGTVHALDADTGKPVWEFDDGGAMLHMYSSPHLAGGRLCIGEGMHANFDCKLTCLDAVTGKKLWRFPATSHIESTACVADGRVFFGAGDDGVYALDAVSGTKIWQFRESHHIDSSPTVALGKVFVGSGVSRRMNTTELLALDAATGKPVWRKPVEMPAWGSPAVDRGRVFFGLGHGRLNRSEASPAGKLVCLDATDGRRLWECPVPDAVMARPAVDARRVYFGARDGQIHAVDRTDGRIVWRYDAGGPVLTEPALYEGRLYVTGGGGRVACLDAQTGAELMAVEMSALTRAECRVSSSPALVPEAGGRVRVYFGADVRSTGQNEAILYCVRF